MTSEIKPEDVKLPEPEAYIWSPLMSRKRFLDFDLPDVECHYEPLFTADQVRAAVLEAKAQERERCARLATRIAEEDDAGTGYYEIGYRTGARCVAAAIMNPNHPYDAIRRVESITETQPPEG